MRAAVWLGHKAAHVSTHSQQLAARYLPNRTRQAKREDEWSRLADGDIDHLVQQSGNRRLDLPGGRLPRRADKRSHAAGTSARRSKKRRRMFLSRINASQPFWPIAASHFSSIEPARPASNGVTTLAPAARMPSARLCE